MLNVIRPIGIIFESVLVFNTIEILKHHNPSRENLLRLFFSMLLGAVILENVKNLPFSMKDRIQIVNFSTSLFVLRAISKEKNKSMIKLCSRAWFLCLPFFASNTLGLLQHLKS